MRVYISWYYGDPEYQLIDRNCYVLVSPTSVPKNWKIEQFLIKPKGVMVDSGSYHFISKENESNVLKISQKKVFKMQLRLLGKFRPAVICHLDFPIPRKNQLTKKEKDERVQITLENAEKFYDLYLRYRDKSKMDGIIPLGVIQGYDEQSVIYCAKHLNKIGYSNFGIGSLSFLSSTNRREILKRIISTLKITKSLHVFGVTSISMMKELKKLNIKSIDSSTPIKESIYCGVIYSKPFRRFKIETEYFLKRWKKTYGFAGILREPLPCECPVCKSFGSEVLLKRGKKIWNNLRALHNYYHLKREIIGCIKLRPDSESLLREIFLKKLPYKIP